MRLFLVRHVTTVWNEEGRLQGHGDSPPSARGEREVAALQRAFQGHEVEAIYTSDLGRALRTAQAIAAVTGAPVRPDPRLRERDYGQLEGLTPAEIQQRFAGQPGLDWDGLIARPPGGEFRPERDCRLAAALDDILAASHSGNLVVVTHGGSVRPTLERLLGPSPQEHPYAMRNAAITEILIDGTGASLLRLDDTSHLP